MPWPRLQDYNEAVQNPRLAFSDPDLRDGQPELTALGLPRAVSGGFASVYKIRSGGAVWAARCFSGEVADHQERYAAISAHLQGAKLSYAVPFTYLPYGIKVGSERYPLVKMEWVQGLSLNAFIGQSLGYRDTLISLAAAWAQMVVQLRREGIAHGDLQHGNVLVVGDRLRLIDYDGMFVPSLKGRKGLEAGHRNYQHPGRSQEDYGPHLDNFSAWVVYISVVAVADHPELWAQHGGGEECLLLRKEDFLNPRGSAVLAALRRSGNTQISALADLFTSLLNFSPEDVPPLDHHEHRLPPIVTASSSPGAAWWRDHPPVSQTNACFGPPDEDAVLSHAGVGCAEWVHDWMASGGELGRPLGFEGPFLGPRILGLGTLISAAGFGFVVDVPGHLHAGAVIGIFVLNLAFCLLRYRQDPRVLEFQMLERVLADLRRRVQEQDGVRLGLIASRTEQLEKVGTIEKSAAASLTKEEARYQSEIQLIQQRADVILRRIDQQRQTASQAEAVEIQEARRDKLKKAGAILNELGSLARSESEEKARALKTMQDAYVLAYLKQRGLWEAWIDGIGPVFKSRLSSAGILSAADVDRRALRISGIGSSRYRALELWRARLELTARGEAPSRLGTAEVIAIESKWRAHRARLESDNKILEGELAAKIGLAQSKAARWRDVLRNEEEQARLQCAKELAVAQQKHLSTITAIQETVTIARRNAQPSLTTTSEEIRRVQNELFGLQWKLGKEEKVRHRFKRLSFMRYLYRVVGGEV